MTRLEPVTTLFPRGRFWARVLARATAAQVSGALQPIETEASTVEQDGVPFVIRLAVNLERKRQADAAGTRGANPFLPYDPDLFVADVTPSHVCLFNKFNVVDHHLLVVTRRFEPQDDILTFADFEAVSTCLAEIEGLAFYNSGPDAGASQAHKHLQIVPFPLGPDLLPFPFASLLDRTDMTRTGPVARLNFRHAIAALNPSADNDVAAMAEEAQAVYGLLLDAVGLAPLGSEQLLRAAGPYNLIMTRRWMMVVPRSVESHEGISVNALGFVGSLFVRNRSDYARVLDLGPLSLLRAVAVTESGDYLADPPSLA
ncbi:MAG: hypothetical protein U1E83_08555 [Methylotetracoccus sp.]